MSENMQKTERMKELVKILSEASYAYYAKDEEIISNYEYDRLYDELEALEKECDMVLAGSPTMKVGYEAVDELPKEKHAAPMLSLGKTKDREEMKSFIGEQKGLLSWKLDGLTVVLTYENGKLSKAVTRGNGEVGEVVTNNAKFFKNIPLKIAHEGTLVIRGEAVIGYEDFRSINAKITDPALQYKNPRNLCSGSVRQLNNQITAERHVRFFAFSLVEAEGKEYMNSRQEQMEFLKQLGFEVVEYKEVTAENMLEAIEEFAEKITTYDIPSDGLVLIFDDIAYGKSLGRTAKFPRDAIAFKWADEVRETVLKEINRDLKTLKRNTFKMKNEESLIGNIIWKPYSDKVKFIGFIFALFYLVFGMFQLSKVGFVAIGFFFCAIVCLPIFFYFKNILESRLFVLRIFRIVISLLMFLTLINSGMV